MGVTAGIVEFADFDNTKSGEATSRETKESRFEASNQWSIDRCATRPEGLRHLPVWNWSGALFGVWIFAPPCGALNGPCHGAILARFGSLCWYSRC